jgi:hypothetical protein
VKREPTAGFYHKFDKNQRPLEFLPFEVSIKQRPSKGPCSMGFDGLNIPNIANNQMASTPHMVLVTSSSQVHYFRTKNVRIAEIAKILFQCTTFIIRPSNIRFHLGMYISFSVLGALGRDSSCHRPGNKPRQQVARV